MESVGSGVEKIAFVPSPHRKSRRERQHGEEKSRASLENYVNAKSRTSLETIVRRWYGRQRSVYQNQQQKIPNTLFTTIPYHTIPYYL
eukprot:scaffold5325_cov183-Amphora_coffeaeformis.AAC.15